MTNPRKPTWAALALAALLASAAALAQTVQKSAVGLSGGAMGDATMKLRGALGGFAGSMTGAAHAIVSGFAAGGYQPGTTIDLAAASNSAGALTITWSAPGADGSVNGLAGNLTGKYRIDLSSDPAHPFEITSFTDEVSTTAVTPGTAQLFGRSSLLGNATYFIKLFTLDASAASDASNLATALTQAFAPDTVAVSTANVSTNTVTFQWAQGNNSAATVFQVELATAPGGSPVALSPFAASLAFHFTGLTPATTHFARVRARNSAGTLTAYTDLGSVFLPAPEIIILPSVPLGVSGSFPDANSFTLSWNRVSTNVQEQAAAITGYNVYKTSSTTGTPELKANVAQSTNTSISYTDPVGAVAENLYFVRSVDDKGRESGDSAYISSKKDAPDQVTSDDKQVVIVIAKDESAFLKESQNAAVTIATRDEDVGGTVLKSYHIIVKDITTGEVKANFTFRTPLTLTFNIPRTGSPSRPLGLDPTDIAVFHHNGVEFIKLGGEVNPFNNTITLQTSRPGIYQLRPSLRPSQFTVTRTVPTKIFTPNGDCVNDFMEIIIDNPATSLITSARVYDIGGREIADLKQGCTQACTQVGMADCLRWDGRSTDGEAARSGIYIWQIKAEDKTSNGTMVLAR